MPEIPSAQELLQRNQEYAAQHKPAISIEEMLAMGDDAPRPKTIIFCCFDARAEPSAFLGLNPGEAVIVRTGGGAVAPNLDYLISLDYLMQGFKDVLVIQHTDCGALHLKNDQIKQHLKDHHLGTDETIESFQFDFDMSLEERVRKNVQVIKDSPHIRQELKDHARGFIYDIKTGRLTEHNCR